MSELVAAFYRFAALEDLPHLQQELVTLAEPRQCAARFCWRRRG
jgi:hypothetical protein